MAYWIEKNVRPFLTKCGDTIWCMDSVGTGKKHFEQEILEKSPNLKWD